MARRTSTTYTLFFLLATLVGCVFTLPLLQRDAIQLEDDLQLVSGDVSAMYDRITIPWRTSIPVRNLRPLKRNETKLMLPYVY